MLLAVMMMVIYECYCEPCVQAVKLSCQFRFIISYCLRSTLHRQSCWIYSHCRCLHWGTPTSRDSTRITSSHSILSRHKVCVCVCVCVCM